VARTAAAVRHRRRADAAGRRTDHGRARRPRLGPPFDPRAAVRPGTARPDRPQPRDPVHRSRVRAARTDPALGRPARPAATGTVPRAGRGRRRRRARAAPAARFPGQRLG
jgi:hypothetical protein